MSESITEAQLRDALKERNRTIILLQERIGYLEHALANKIIDAHKSPAAKTEKRGRGRPPKI